MRPDERHGEGGQSHAAESGYWRLAAEAVGNTHDILYSIAVDGTVTFVGPQVANLGYTPAEVIGRNITEFIHPGDVARVLSDHQRTMETGEEFPTVCRLVARDGTEVWVEELGKIVKENGEVVGTAGVLRDVTKRVRAEDALKDQLAFLRALLDTIPSPIFYKSADGIYQGCNTAFEAVLGLPREEIVGKTVYDVAPKDLADKYREMDDALLAEQGVQVYEGTVLYTDGVRHDVVFHKATYSHADGAVAGLVGVMLDITERKSLEKELREADRVRVLAESAGAAAHEIGQPLSVLLARTELMVAEEQGDRQRERVLSLRGAAERIRDIVHKMAGIREYATRPYMSGRRIADLDQASRPTSAKEKGT